MATFLHLMGRVGCLPMPAPQEKVKGGTHTLMRTRPGLWATEVSESEQLGQFTSMLFHIHPCLHLVFLTVHRDQPVLSGCSWVWPCSGTWPLAWPLSTDVPHLSICENSGLQATCWWHTWSAGFVWWASCTVSILCGQRTCPLIQPWLILLLNHDVCISFDDTCIMTVHSMNSDDR